jgi:hypothetical protein
VAYVLAVTPRNGVWAPAEEAHTPREAAAELAWTSPEQPGDWTPVARRFRDGHTQTWWAADASLPAAGWGPDRRLRLVVATTDPATLPKLTTWYLITNLRRPGRRRASAFAPADLAEVVRLYSLRNWVEQGYKQVKGELGWADFQVRSDRAIRRHWQLVCCAFSFCWRAFLAEHPPPRRPPDEQAADAAAVGGRRPVRPPGPTVAVVAWPVTLRRVRGWLTPWVVLGRWRRAWSGALPPLRLRLLLDSAHAGRPLHLYLPP